jgi:hypothetical protein
MQFEKCNRRKTVFKEEKIRLPKTTPTLCILYKTKRITNKENIILDCEEKKGADNLKTYTTTQQVNANMLAIK